MGFVFKQDAVNSLVLEVTAAASSVGNGLKTVQEASDDISSRGDWQGNKATAVKDYLAHVHGAIIASMSLLMKDIYDPHGEDGSTCEMIQSVKIDIPDEFATIAFPTVQYDASGNPVSTAETKTVIYVNFDDIDDKNDKENYGFEVTITVTGTYDADIKDLADYVITVEFTDLAAQKAGDCTVLSFQVQ